MSVDSKINGSEKPNALEGSEVKQTTSKSESLNGSASGNYEENKNPYIETVLKKLRSLGKKKQKIEQLESRDIETLNKDQKAVLASKEAVNGALKEYEEIVKQFKTIEVSEKIRVAEQKKSMEAGLESRLQKATEQGVNVARKEILSLVQFLRHASYLRQNPSGVPAEDAAVERLLALSYEGRSSSVDLVVKLASAASDVIEGTEGVTFERIKNLVDAQAEILDKPAELYTSDEVPETPLSVEDIEDNQRQNNSSSEIGQKKIPINFLVESEIEPSHQQILDEMTSAPIQSMQSVPAQSVADEYVAGSQSWSNGTGQHGNAESGWGNAASTGGNDWSTAVYEAEQKPLSQPKSFNKNGQDTQDSEWSVQRSQRGDRGRGRGRGRGGDRGHKGRGNARNDNSKPRGAAYPKNAS